MLSSSSWSSSEPYLRTKHSRSHSVMQLLCRMGTAFSTPYLIIFFLGTPTCKIMSGFLRSLCALPLTLSEKGYISTRGITKVGDAESKLTAAHPLTVPHQLLQQNTTLPRMKHGAPLKRGPQIPIWNRILDSCDAHVYKDVPSVMLPPH